VDDVNNIPTKPVTTSATGGKTAKTGDMGENTETTDDEKQAADLLAQAMSLLNKPKPQTANPIDMDKLLQLIQDAVSDATKDLVIGQRMLQDELNAVKTANVQTLSVQVNDKPAKPVKGLVHRDFDKILRMVAAGVKPFLVGPAGSGKTTISGQIAEALGLDFRAISVNAQTSKSDFLGYNDATGKYVSTPFREMYENGGLFLLDEIDAGNPNVLTALNSALDNGFCSFADKNVNRHVDFKVITGANTYGTGASYDYVGRNQLDGATLDRFRRVNFLYDEVLETKLATSKTWCKFVQAVRYELQSERVIVSPRATYDGCKLLAQKFSPLEVTEMCFTDSMSQALKQRVMEVFNRQNWKA